MNTPPLLLGAAIFFWGGLGDHALVAILIAAMLEGARLVRWRVDIPESVQMRLTDGTTMMALAIGVMLYLAHGFPRAAVLFFEWLPVMLLPVGLMQAYGAAREIDMRVLFWSLRKRQLREPRGANLGYPYLVLWVIAASATPARGPEFDVGLAVILAWALWPLRSRGRNVAAWAVLVALAAGFGHLGGVALHDLQLWLEGAAPEWITGGGTKVNPYRGTTDIGRLGQLKMSDAIVLRVRPEFELKPPLLLHQASYNDYVGVNWIARGGTFKALAPERGSWRLGAGPEGRTLAIVDVARGGDPVLALPQGSATLELDARAVKRNPLGTVQAERPPGFATYRVGFGPGGGSGDAPTPAELRLPEAERATIERLAAQWGLTGLAPREAVATIRQRFLSDYSYSTFQKSPPSSATPLADFLLRTRSGHCEHFASATTLLLRAAGVPARYASGYSVQERSALEDAWIARERHSHAWARAYVDGKWIDVDATPPIWFELEGDERPAWAFLGDAWSFARFRITRAMEESGISGPAIGFGVLITPFLMYLAWKLARSLRRSAVRTPSSGPAIGRPDPTGSEFARIVAHLAASGLPRAPSETVREWIERIAPRVAGDVTELTRLAALHYRLRYDPAGLTAAERDDLATSAARWIIATPTRVDKRRESAS